MANHGIDKLVSEMWCLAASIILGCEKCINAHETELKIEGTTSLQVQTIAKISAIGNVIRNNN